MADYTLPDLPYDYAALEPHISGRIMELHHDKHHAAYVAGANAALEKLAAARDSGDFAAVNLHEKNLAFNLGGHVNHSVFWQNLSPAGGARPEGELAAAQSHGAHDELPTSPGPDQLTGAVTGGDSPRTLGLDGATGARER